jgi:hypothetical protein
MKEEALDRTLWRTRFGSYEPDVRQTTDRRNSQVKKEKRMNYYYYYYYYY